VRGGENRCGGGGATVHGPRYTPLKVKAKGENVKILDSRCAATALPAPPPIPCTYPHDTRRYEEGPTKRLERAKREEGGRTARLPLPPLRLWPHAARAQPHPTDTPPSGASTSLRAPFAARRGRARRRAAQWAARLRTRASPTSPRGRARLAESTRRARGAG